MQVEFDYVFDDLREGSAASARYLGQLAQEEAKRKPKAFQLGALLVWLILGGMAALVLTARWMAAPGGLFAAVPNLWLRLLGPFVAFVLMMTGIPVINRITARLQERAGPRVGETPEERSARWRGRLGLAMFVGLCLLALVLLWTDETWRLRASRAFAGEQLAADAIIVFAPWIAMLTFVWAFIWRIGRRSSGVRKQWEETPELHRRQTLDVGAEGVTLCNGISRTQWQWVAFTGFSESVNLFLLYMGKPAFMMIPKRAFEAGELAEFRQWVTSRIEVGPCQGFPVVLVERASEGEAGVRSEEPGSVDSRGGQNV